MFERPADVDLSIAAMFMAMIISIVMADTTMAYFKKMR